jgi:hypothetical protein
MPRTVSVAVTGLTRCVTADALFRSRHTLTGWKCRALSAAAGERGIRINPTTRDRCCRHLPMRASLETWRRRSRRRSPPRTWRNSGLSGPPTLNGAATIPTTAGAATNVIADFDRLKRQGASGAVTETATGAIGVLCQLRVEWPDAADRSRGETFTSYTASATGASSRSSAATPGLALRGSRRPPAPWASARATRRLGHLAAAAPRPWWGFPDDSTRLRDQAECDRSCLARRTACPRTSGPHPST